MDEAAGYNGGKCAVTVALLAGKLAAIRLIFFRVNGPCSQKFRCTDATEKFWLVILRKFRIGN